MTSPLFSSCKILLIINIVLTWICRISNASAHQVVNRRVAVASQLSADTSDIQQVSIDVAFTAVSKYMIVKHVPAAGAYITVSRHW